MRNEALMCAYKADFDRKRVTDQPMANILRIDRPEGVRLDLRLDVLKVENRSVLFGKYDKGLLCISIRSSEGWKCIPGRILIDAQSGNIFRIVDSNTYCGYDDEFYKEDMVGGSCLDACGAPSAAEVEEKFMFETDNHPLITCFGNNDPEMLRCLDILAKMGFFYHTMDLAVHGRTDYSAELHFALRSYLNYEEDKNRGATLQEFLDEVNSSYCSDSSKSNKDVRNFFFNEPVVSEKFKEPKLKFREISEASIKRTQPTQSSRSLFDLADEISNIDVDNIFGNK